MPTIRSRPEPSQRFESVWDAITDSPEEAEAMKAWSKLMMEDESVYIGDDGFLYYHDNWVIQGKQA